MNAADKSSRPFYSLGQIALATILGSPLAGAWLMARNYRATDEKKKERRCIIYSVTGTAALLVLAFMVPASVPHSGFAAGVAAAMIQVARWTQGPMISEHYSSGGQKGSWWVAAGIGVLGLIVVLAVVTVVMFLPLRANEQERAPSSVVTVDRGASTLKEQRRLNDKEVLVRGWKDEELKRILDDFTAMYHDRLSAEFRMLVKLMPESVTLITFPDDIPPPLFAWLVNYIRYPKAFDLNKRSILVVGKTTLSAAFGPAEEKMIGQRALFYVPTDDREYDLVFVKVGATTYELSFARGAWKPTTKDRIPAGLDILMRERPNP